MMRVRGGDDDSVHIQLGNKPGDPFIITVNCPDKTGLACDICRFILHFGLCILKGGTIFSVKLFSYKLYPVYYYVSVSCLMFMFVSVFHSLWPY